MGLWEGTRALCVCAALLLWVNLSHAQATTRPAVPTRAQITTASRQVEELRSRGQRTASSLLELARQTTSSAALRYAAADRAMSLAAEAGEISVAVEAMEEVSASFEVDRLELKLQLLKSLAGSKRRGSAAILAMRWINEAYVAGRVNTASEMADIITACQTDLSEALRSAAERHLLDNAAAKRAAGGKLVGPTAALYRCLYQQQWKDNLAGLAGTEFAELATQDAAATDQAQQMTVADAWWQRANSADGMQAWRVASRAAQLYGEMLPRVDGVERELAAGRIAEHQRRLLLEQGYQPGAIREVWRETGKDRHAEVAQEIELARDDATVELPKKDGHVRWRGQLLIELPGRYEFTFIGGSSLRVAVDGVTQVDNPTAYNKRSGIKLPLELSPGLHSFEIEVASRSSAPRLTVQWITPGAYDRKAIPTSMIFHDSLLLQ